MYKSVLVCAANTNASRLKQLNLPIYGNTFIFANILIAMTSANEHSRPEVSERIEW